jgi:hypothetical protein
LLNECMIHGWQNVGGMASTIVLQARPGLPAQAMDVSI